MKKLIQTIVLACASVTLLTGCALFRDGETKTTTCTTAAAALAAYQAVVAAGQSPSQAQIQAAAGAAAFLTAWCGWSDTRGIDPNGVPIILPPADQ